MTTQPIVREFEADLKVVAAVEAATDVVALTLAAEDGAALPPWTPGAHIDLVLGEDLVRQYSLCGSPADTGQYRLGVLRAPDSRGGSKTVHAELHEGATVRVRGPRNHFPMVASPRYLFIAGGIGITPMLPMIAEAEASGAEWRLVYGGRTRSSMAFLDELAAYGDKVSLLPQDEAGFPDLDALLGEPVPDTLVYTCGPTGLLDAVEERCSASWPVGSLHLERFSAKAPAADEQDSAFELVLQRSGLTLEVPADKSIFEVCREAGVSVVGSCLEGVCGTCETEVVEGDVEHRDSILNEEERESNEFMMICVSRCRGDRLTLDL
ncbi:PDR/VanB family oxidoreductase [Nocardioides daeguensis]|uniref:PDR/VanB family oxidoreductase n=1 Tax=Nocardioides daeguensis TaxID=908359 RepID=A0ABP6WB95_9ACTN|nr:PDR/VanB family oxidoreductase [Nocardioides daeguensis]MBV6729309.1 PDR/VanB family oxidoreductase [Nocardioides daeguensis]MCR1774285.1 PDR/VanB family oxidoreductase [Nocardioides daeguensis]